MNKKKFKYKENVTLSPGNSINFFVIFFDNLLIELKIQIKNLKFYFLYFFTKKLFFLKKNNSLKNIYYDEKIFILGNGPAIKNYDLSKLDKKILITVNRFYNNSKYTSFKSNIHIFIDDKLTNGTWSTNYIDDILTINPDCKIILNADWYYLEIFTKYRNKKNIFWIKINLVSSFFDNFKTDATKIVSMGGGVVECAISLSIFLGSKNLNILGVEGNGISRLMCNQNSHFNGNDVDYNNHNSLMYAHDMISSARGIRQWHRISSLLNKRNIDIYNLTKEGILDAYEYKSFDIATK
jgi:hypothetical protein